MSGSARAVVEQQESFEDAEQGLENDQPKVGCDPEALVIDHRENGRKLARSILRRWRVRMAPEEVDSIVDLTLCEAANRYDPTKGAAFMTFFYYHLRGHLVRAVASAANSSNIFMAYANNNGLEVGDWKGHGDDLLQHFLPDNSLFGRGEENGPEQKLLSKERLTRCEEAISKLDELEQAVIRRSFSGDEQLVAIASSLGYSRCHISRVKKRALERLRGLLETGEQKQVQGNEAPTLNTRASVAERKQKRRRRRRQISRDKLAAGGVRGAISA